MKAECRFIISRSMARSFAVRPRSRALFVLCTTLCIGVSAQERIIMDLPLPPAAGVQQISASPQALQGAAPASALTSKQATNLPAAHTSAPKPTSRPASGELAGASRSTSPGAARGAIKSQVKDQNRQFQVLRLTLREGESLYRIFRRHGLSQTDLLNMTHSSRAIGRRLGRLQPGQELRIEVTASSNVNRLVLIKPGPTDVSIERRAPQRYAMREVADSAPAPRAQALPRTPVRHLSRRHHISRTSAQDNSRSRQATRCTRYLTEPVFNRASWRRSFTRANRPPSCAACIRDKISRSFCHPTTPCRA